MGAATESRKIVVVGGGFAGLWAAVAAVRESRQNNLAVDIQLVSRDPYLTIRPRLYEADPQSLRVPLAATLSPLDIAFVEGGLLEVNTEASAIGLADTAGQNVQIEYDRLILATGSALRPLKVPGFKEYSFSIDAYADAMKFEDHLKSQLKIPAANGSHTLVVVGAGFTGIELATELRPRIRSIAGDEVADAARILLIDHSREVGKDLGDNPRADIKAALQAAKVEVKLGVRVEQFAEDYIVLSNDERIETATAVVTAGLHASDVANLLFAEQDDLGRLKVDRFLRVPERPGIYATGDIARAYVDEDHVALMSCQHAQTMGKYAGYNAVRDLLGLELRSYRQLQYVTCLDLGGSGALFTTGWEREVVHRGEEGKALKKAINTQKIYPPQNDPALILQAAALDFKAKY